MSLPSVADSGAGVAPSSYPEPHLKRVLRTYQSAASSSLSGPNGLLAERAEPPPAAAAPNPGLLYYSVLAGLPLPVVAPPSAAKDPLYRAGVRVKSEPDDKMAPPAPEYDAFKLWKLKQPACYAIAKDKDAVDLSAGRPTSPAPAAPPSQRQPSPQPSFPILSAPDRGGRHAERGETLLEGQPIACFTVGGEPRLCLPQILNTALYRFHHGQIASVCDELNINCSLCTAAQLDSLKAAPAILPRSAPSCGLITKSDAQRLCSALLRGANPEQHRSRPKRAARPEERPADRKPGSPACKTEPRDADKEPAESGETGETAKSAKSAESPKTSESACFRVYHQCFGKCEGVCRPELYTSADAACIECADCGLQLSPADFVSHAHRAPENRTCHWGFDADRWRAYLLLARRQPAGQHEALVRQLDEFKSRFDSRAGAPQQPAPPAAPPVKRKFQVEDMLKPSTRPASEASGVEQQPFVKRYKDHLVVVGSGGRQSPFEAPFAYAYAPSGQLVLGVPRESPPLLQEAPARAPHSKDGQPNVALLAPPRSAPARQPAAPDRAEPVPAPSNPEIELSSTDTDDSDSMHSQNGDGKSNWDLPAGLANQVNSVEDLLRRGGCDAPSSRLILQAFRRLAYRVCWAEEKQQQQQRHREADSRSPSVLKLRTDLTDVEAAKYKAM